MAFDKSFDVLVVPRFMFHGSNGQPGGNPRQASTSRACAAACVCPGVLHRPVVQSRYGAGDPEYFIQL
jgi:hypothetical protein